MRRQTARQIVAIRRLKQQELVASDAYIRDLTDDQFLLYLTMDALDQAELDLQHAIEELETFKRDDKLMLISLRLKVITIASIKRILTVLAAMPPQAILTPLIMIHIMIMIPGTAWLWLHVHAPWQVLWMLAFFHILAFPVLRHAKDHQVKALLEATLQFTDEIAQELHDKHLLLHQPTTEVNHND